jgi:hypothetical protein
VAHRLAAHGWHLAAPADLLGAQLISTHLRARSVVVGDENLRRLLHASKGRGGFAGAFAQKHSQGVGMFVADFPGDGLQGLLGCAEQVRCSFDPQILDEADGRNSQGALDGVAAFVRSRQWPWRLGGC